MLTRALQLRLLSLISSLLLVITFAHANETLSAEKMLPNDELRILLQQAIQNSDSFEDRFDAEVWLLDMSNRLKKKIKNPEKRLQLLRQIHQEAKKAELHPELVLAVIDVESNFDRFAISTAGAQGLMQVMPFWLKEIGQPRDSLFNVRTNLRMGCTILKYYLDFLRARKSLHQVMVTLIKLNNCNYINLKEFNLKE